MDENDLYEIETGAEISNQVLMIHIKGLRRDMSNLSGVVGEFIKTCKEEYVTKEAFEPVRKIVYGFVTAILTVFATGIIGAAVVWIASH